MLHLTIGPVSLRLEPSAAEDLALMLNEGLLHAPNPVPQGPARLRLVRGDG